jgi:hypothetical protein
MGLPRQKKNAYTNSFKAINASPNIFHIMVRQACLCGSSVCMNDTQQHWFKSTTLAVTETKKINSILINKLMPVP